MVEDNGQAGAEIEVTPEMIEAGVHYLRESGWITEEDEPFARGLRFLVRDLFVRVCGSEIRLHTPTNLSLIEHSLRSEQS